MKQIVGLVLILCCTQIVAQEVFPDGKAIPEWFRENKEVNVNALGKKYSITDYGVANDSTVVQTKKIQGVIDLAARNGGGVIVIPKGTFLSGSLFFKNNTHLHLEEDAVLKGSDDISHFPVKMTRMEGQTLKYFMALVKCRRTGWIYNFRKGNIEWKRASVLEVILVTAFYKSGLHQYGRNASSHYLFVQL